jgi:CRP/FNR family transcriptional regulator, dissimilatory nitrate respiration regulator
LEDTLSLEQCYLFNRLDTDALAQLQAITVETHYPKGSTLFYAGEMPRRLLLVHSGSVQVSKHDASGNEIVLTRFHANDLVAEMAHFEAIPYPATARCIDDVTLYEIDFSAFKAHFLANPELSLNIIRSLTRKIKQLESVIHRGLVDDARTRLARYLLEHRTALDKVTQREMARQIFLTPETVSRLIRTFKAEGWVDVRAREVIVTDAEGLASVLDD